MPHSGDRIAQIVTSLDALVAREQDVQKAAIAEILEALQAVQGTSADRRLVRLVTQLRQFRDRLGLLDAMIRDDYLAKLSHLLEHADSSSSASRALAIIEALADVRPRSLHSFCEVLLDQLVAATEAERGFVLFYVPESSEADIVAARNFETTNLSLGEHGFSRTIVRAVLDRRTTLVLDDAAADPSYRHEASVSRLPLRSVMAVPLVHFGRTIGVVYLENNSAPRVFSTDDERVATTVARFGATQLRAARLLPDAGRENRVLLDASRASAEIVGDDPSVQSILATVERIADSPATVLIEGESGTGKELVARALHYRSARRDHPFVTINCASIPENLLESELFGHERGAFTGAVERRLGRFEQGNGGTVFLDEIGELAYGLQAKLLRFLQSQEVQRLGGRDTVRVDVRLVVATSRDLQAMMRDGAFQEALYYRIHVVPIVVPALRQRRGDIVLLAEHFLDRFSAVYGRRVCVDADAIACLVDYAWPGNIRELENVMHRLVALAETDEVRVGDLPAEILGDRAQRVSLFSSGGNGDPVDMQELRSLREAARRRFAVQERRLVEEAVRRAGGNVTEAAARLGMHRVTLHKVLRTRPE